MAKEEGARSFSVTLGQVEEGALLADLTDSLHEINKVIAAQALIQGKATGTLTLVMKLTADRRGTVQVEADVKTKLPKPKKASQFWMSPGDNLILENPRQPDLPIRDVSLPTQRDAPADGRRTKEV